MWGFAVLAVASLELAGLSLAESELRTAVAFATEHWSEARDTAPIEAAKAGIAVACGTALGLMWNADLRGAVVAFRAARDAFAGVASRAEAG